MQVNQATECLYIVKPFSAKGVSWSLQHASADRGAGQAAAPDAAFAAVGARRAPIAILSEVTPPTDVKTQYWAPI